MQAGTAVDEGEYLQREQQSAQGEEEGKPGLGMEQGYIYWRQKEVASSETVQYGAYGC